MVRDGIHGLRSHPEAWPAESLCVESAKALWTGMPEFRLAWPFTRLVLGELDDFIDRWAGWFADAADGRLTQARRKIARMARSWCRSKSAGGPAMCKTLSMQQT